MDAAKSEKSINNCTSKRYLICVKRKKYIEGLLDVVSNSGFSASKFQTKSFASKRKRKKEIDVTLTGVRNKRSIM